MNEKIKIKHFTDLEAWKESHKLVLIVYKLTNGFPKNELFGITNQIRRAVTSVSANIAEGISRYSYKDRVRFYFNSRSSLAEVEDFLLIAKDVGYIKNDFSVYWDQCEKTATILNGLIKSTKKFIN